MWELLLDREERAAALPIITTDPSVEMGLEFKAGRIYQVNADVNQYREMQMAPSSSSYWNALTTLRGVIQSTGSGVHYGDADGEATPYRHGERGQFAQQQKEATGLYFMFYQDLIEQKVWITLMNMIQFYTSHKVEKIIGDRKFHKILSLSEARLSGGGLGNREVRITDQPASSDELRKESYLRSLMRKERVEIIEVSPKPSSN